MCDSLSRAGYGCGVARAGADMHDRGRAPASALDSGLPQADGAPTFAEGAAGSFACRLWTDSTMGALIGDASATVRGIARASRAASSELVARASCAEEDQHA